MDSPSPAPTLPEKLIVAAFQWAIDREEPERNLEAVDRLLEKAREIPTFPDLMVFPEMWSRSFCGRRLVEEARALDQRLEFCAERARRHHCWIAAGTLPEPAGKGKVFNTFFLFDSSGKIRLTYRKIHLYPNTSEPIFFKGGDALPEPLDLGDWKIGVGICFDLRFPELFRLQVKHGANLFLCPVQFPRRVAELLKNLSCVRGVENQAVMVVANRWGSEGPHVFGGGSLIVDPAGTVLSSCGPGENIVWAELSAGQIRANRKEHPYLEMARLLGVDFRK